MEQDRITKYMVTFWQDCDGVQMEHFKFDQTWSEVIAILKLRIPSQEKEFVIVDMKEADMYLSHM